MKRPNMLFRLRPDELRANSREIQDKTFRNLPDSHIILFGLALEGKSSYLIGWPPDSRAYGTLSYTIMRG